MDFILPASPSWYCSRVLDCDSRGIACFGSKNAIYAWDVSSKPPKFLSYITAHLERVVGVTLCPGIRQQEVGRQRCCSAGEDKKVKVWDLNSRALLEEHEMHKNKLTCVHWSPNDHDLIASGDEKGTVVIWNISSKETWSWQPDFSNCNVFCISFCPNAASLLAVGFKTGNIVIVDVNKKKLEVIQRLRGHEDEIHSIAWSPSSDDSLSNTGGQFPNEVLVASSSRDKTIRLWNLQSGQPVKVLTLPNSSGYHRREEAGMKVRVWITLCWPPNSPLEFLSSGLSGEVLVWNIEKQAKTKCQEINPGSSTRGHSRIVFNIAVGGPGFKTITSISMDRQIIIWDLESQCSRYVIPTLGGFVYAIDQSPTHPSQFATGVGDCLLRVCSLMMASNSCEVQTFWQGIKAKVTAVSWHPALERLLAYGTEDGKVGIYDVHSSSPPQISSTYHKKTVYGVYWAPACGGKHGDSEYSLYSVGDGVIFQHKPTKLDQQAEDLNVLIMKTNGYLERTSGYTALSWNEDDKHVAIGNEDGNIDIYLAPHLKHVCSIHVHKKLVNCVKWHPLSPTDAVSGSSACGFWLASGSNESVVHVFNLQKVLAKSSADGRSKPTAITDSFCQLEGHTSRVVHLSWSPHQDGLLASASFDCTVQVWDVKHRKAVKNYRGHHGHVLCVQWSRLDPDVIYSGSDDHTLQSWRISEQTHTTPPAGHEKQRFKMKLMLKGSDFSREPLHTQSAEVIDQTSLVKSEDSVSGHKTELDHDELLRLCEQKRQEMMAKSQAAAEDLLVHLKTTESDYKSNQDYDSNVWQESEKSEEVVLSSKSHVPSLSRELGAKKDNKDHKKRRVKSLFPKSSAADNRGKQPTQQDCIDFAKFKYSADVAKLESDHAHLGCFADRRNTYSLFSEEELYHLEHENFEQLMTLSVFKGNTRDVLQLAADRGLLNDHLMAMAPIASADCWEEMCIRYANQLVKERLFHKASTYYLAANQVYEAIAMFKENKLYKEAVCLARVRLSQTDPLLEDLFISWGNHMAKDGNYELAAKCYLAVNNPKLAASCLAKRPDLSALRAAALVSASANETEVSRIYAQKFVLESILASDWTGAAELIRASPSFTVLALPLSIYETLACELTSQNLLTGIVPDDDHKQNTSSSSNISRKMPEFSLDLDKMDPLCIWKPILINKEPLLLYILRTWHEAWNITFTISCMKDLFSQLLSFYDAKQNQIGDKQILLEVSFSIAFCILKMLLCNFNGGAVWMTAAISKFEDDSQLTICQALCRLLLPQGPLYFRHLGLQVRAFQMATLDSSQMAELLMQMPGAPETSTCDETLDHDVDDNLSVSTSHKHCNESDGLTAVYYFTVLKFLLLKDSATGFYHLPDNVEVSKGFCPKSRFLEESMIEDMCSKCANYKYIASLARKLLWDVQLQIHRLLDSEIYIQNAVASLVSSHRAVNQTPLQTSHVLYDISKKSSEELESSMAAQESENSADNRRVRKQSGDYLLMYESGRNKAKNLPYDCITALEEKFRTVAGEKESAEHLEEYIVMEKIPECTAVCSGDGTFDPYLVISKASRSDIAEEPNLSCEHYFSIDQHHEATEKNSNVEVGTEKCGTECQDVIQSDRYESIPDDWYSLPIDKKYDLPCVTLIVLQKELSRIRSELSQLPVIEIFPHPLTSAKLLIQFAGCCSQTVCDEKAHEDLVKIIHKLHEWGLNHVYTTDLKAYFMSLEPIVND